MSAISRYIVRTTFGAFVLVVASLTAIVWITQALRELDIVTHQGQGILAFVGITALVIPSLALVIMPIALIVAMAFTLNRLNSDSEIVVMNAAGMSPWRVFAPFLLVAVVVALTVAVVGAYLAPKGLREMRTQLTKVRADMIANLLQPGRFASVDRQLLTIHVRERRSNGELLGLFIDDRRDPEERATFTAEQGRVIEDEDGTFLVLMRGSAQRIDARQQDPAIVLFDRYAFDLTPLANLQSRPKHGVPERYFWELLWPDPADAVLKADPGRRWRELHERLSAPLYPLVFAIIGFAILGAPRTSRQSRGFSIAVVIAAVLAIRLGAFALTVFSMRAPLMIVGLYLLLALAAAVGLRIIARGAIVEPPASMLGLGDALASRLGRLRGAAAPGAAA